MAIIYLYGSQSEENTELRSSDAEKFMVGGGIFEVSIGER
jgi:hypothetical protein